MADVEFGKMYTYLRLIFNSAPSKKNWQKHKYENWFSANPLWMYIRICVNISFNQRTFFF